jgi:succinate dehydrogenase / fumarate reductase cytochrome b subunit
MAKASFGKSSVGRKILMALSGLFLIVFLLQHLSINMLSVISADAFNEVSHFMGTNPIVQFVLQPILIFGVIFHFVMGIKLEIENKKARPIKYVESGAASNSSWMSRNMIITGLVVLAFLGLHFYDFWVHEITKKFIEGDMSGLGADGEFRYYSDVVGKFAGDPVRVGIYVLSFVLLSLHLMHGFQSAFQSMGANHKKYTPIIKKLGSLYAIVVPAGFVVVALYHFING